MPEEEPKPPAGHETLSKEDVLEILRKNGIESVDQLAQMVADEQAGKAFIPDPSIAAGSWIIKVFKLREGLDLLPDIKGGNIINSKIAAAGPKVGGQ